LTGKKVKKLLTKLAVCGLRGVEEDPEWLVGW
jgi:hypothetical protein